MSAHRHVFPLPPRSQKQSFPSCRNECKIAHNDMFPFVCCPFVVSICCCLNQIFMFCDFQGLSTNRKPNEYTTSVSSSIPPNPIICKSWFRQLLINPSISLSESDSQDSRISVTYSVNFSHSHKPLFFNPPIPKSCKSWFRHSAQSSILLSESDSQIQWFSGFLFG